MEMFPAQLQEQQVVNEKANQKTALYALGVVFFMGAMAWASVPLYDLFVGLPDTVAIQMFQKLSLKLS